MTAAAETGRESEKREWVYKQYFRSEEPQCGAALSSWVPGELGRQEGKRSSPRGLYWVPGTGLIESRVIM